MPFRKLFKANPSYNVQFMVNNLESEFQKNESEQEFAWKITVADADGFVVNDGGTMKTIPATDVKTYAAGSAATKGFAIAMAIVFG